MVRSDECSWHDVVFFVAMIDIDVAMIDIHVTMMILMVICIATVVPPIGGLPDDSDALVIARNGVKIVNHFRESLTRKSLKITQAKALHSCMSCIIICVREFNRYMFYIFS